VSIFDDDVRLTSLSVVKNAVKFGCHSEKASGVNNGVSTIDVFEGVDNEEEVEDKVKVEDDGELELEDDDEGEGKNEENAEEEVGKGFIGFDGGKG